MYWKTYYMWINGSPFYRLFSCSSPFCYVPCLFVSCIIFNLLPYLLYLALFSISCLILVFCLMFCLLLFVTCTLLEGNVYFATVIWFIFNLRKKKLSGHIYTLDYKVFVILLSAYYVVKYGHTWAIDMWLVVHLVSILTVYWSLSLLPAGWLFTDTYTVFSTGAV
jgi:hypothetical protein